VPAETIHLIEYGILVWSAMLATSARFSKGKAYLLALGLISLAGAGDEVIQWLLLNRVGEIRDVLINISAGGIGLGFLGLVFGYFLARVFMKTTSIALIMATAVFLPPTIFRPFALTSLKYPTLATFIHSPVSQTLSEVISFLLLDFSTCRFDVACKSNINQENSS